MRRVYLIVGSLVLAGCAFLLLATVLQSAEPPATPPAPGVPTFPPKKLSVEEYRKLYPFMSIADRLAYETERKKELADPVPLPRMTEATAKRLEETEKRLETMPQWDMRRKTLEILHSNEAENFIKRDGFGLSRLPAPSIIFLELPPAPTIPFEKSKETASPGEETKVPLPKTGKGPSLAKGEIPSLDMLGSFHFFGQLNFLNFGGLGYVKDREHVAGFQAHQFRSMPTLGNPPPPPNPKEAVQDKERWLVSRLELVSLLKHKEPVVYVGRELPRMEDLKKGQTRPLSEFEKQALQALYEGEEVIAEGTTNHIRMVGALRASKQCLECHEVRRGDLLGAFSYDLQRDPPLKALQ